MILPIECSLEELDSFGYEDEIVFPVRVRAADTAAPVAIHIDISYVVCKDIRVPLEASVSLESPAGSSAESPGTKAHRNLIQRFAGRVPSRTDARVDIVEASVSGSGGKNGASFTDGCSGVL